MSKTLINTKSIPEALAAIGAHKEIEDILQSQRFLDLAVEKFYSALQTLYAEEQVRGEQEAFVAAIADAELLIEKWLGKLAYFHLCAETTPQR